MAGQSSRFGRRQRLAQEREFHRIFARRCSASAGPVVVFVEHNGLAYPRLGLSVAKRVGSAVVRNRSKRCAREAFRLCQSELPVLDYVCVIRQAGYTTTEFGQVLVRLAREAERRLAARRANA
jgi:ribonuclease P protein component